MGERRSQKGALPSVSWHVTHCHTHTTSCHVWNEKYIILFKSVKGGVIDDWGRHVVTCPPVRISGCQSWVYIERPTPSRHNESRQGKSNPLTVIRSETIQFLCIKRFSLARFETRKGKKWQKTGEMRLVRWDYQISTLYLSLIRLSSQRQINTYFLENKQIRLQRFTNTNWRLASYLCWLSLLNGPKYIIIHENNNAGGSKTIFSPNSDLASLVSLGTGYYFDVKCCSVQSKNVSTHPRPMSRCVIRYDWYVTSQLSRLSLQIFWYQFKNILHMVDNWPAELITWLHNKC